MIFKYVCRLGAATAAGLAAAVGAGVGLTIGAGLTIGVGVGAVTGLAIAGAGFVATAFAGFIAAAAAFVAFLSTPPCPLHAPLPDTEVEPSLHAAIAACAPALEDNATHKAAVATSVQRVVFLDIQIFS